MKREKLTHYYRWQFLRLNKGYQRYYKLYAKGVKAIRKNRKLPEEKKQEYITQLKDKLYIEYGINGIYDYRMKNPPSELRIYGEADFAVQKGTLKGIFEGKVKESQEISGNHLLETIRRPKKVRNRKGEFVAMDVPLVTPKFVQVVINYDAELGDIRSEIDKIIIPTQDLRRAELGVKRPKTRIEAIRKDYKKCLRVWRLSNKGMFPKEIAKKVFPYEDKRAAQDKVIKYRNRAVAFINGGYRKISF